MSSPCDTPCEMFKVCSTGLGPLPALVTKFGGGAPAPVVAIPAMLGAGASGAAAAACNVGVLPPLTTRAAGPGLAAAVVWPGAGDKELEGLVELGAESE